MVKFNRANEHTVCGAGDEVADTFMVDESRHGFAICGFGVIAGQDIFFFFRLAGLEAIERLHFEHCFKGCCYGAGWDVRIYFRERGDSVFDARLGSGIAIVRHSRECACACRSDHAVVQAVGQHFSEPGRETGAHCLEDTAGETNDAAS